MDTAAPAATFQAGGKCHEFVTTGEVGPVHAKTPATEVAGAWLRRREGGAIRIVLVLDDADVFAAGTLGALAAIERDRLSFTKLVEVGLRARRIVEKVFVAVIREDEAEALVRDQPLDCSVHE